MARTITMIKMNVRRWKYRHYGYIKIDAGFQVIFDPENQFSGTALPTSLSIRSAIISGPMNDSNVNH